jgi:hypothetical protein
VQIVRRVVVLVSALALCAPAVVFAQMPDVPPSAPGVSTQPPVELGGEGGSKPRPSTDPGAGQLPNTGSDPRLLCLVGVALTLLGVGLRLRTADADLY